jgi:predicted nucleic acid-binding protein
MTPYFLDTSGLVKRYVAEAGSAWLTGITEVTSGNQCWISVVTQVEVLAALYYRVRSGTLTAALAQKAEALFYPLTSVFCK